MKRMFIITVIVVIVTVLAGCGKTKTHHTNNTPVPSYAVSTYANIPGFETPSSTP